MLRWHLFYPKNKYLKVHSSDVNPSEYVLAIFKGKGLNDYDIIKSSGEMEENEITAEEKQSPEWLYSPQAIVEMLDKGLCYLKFRIQFFKPFIEYNIPN